MTVATLSPDEQQLIQIVRSIKGGTGFGEFTGTITRKSISSVREIKNHKLDLK